MPVTLDCRQQYRSHPNIVLRYPTRAYQPDTTVVSNDRRGHHRAQSNESRPGDRRGGFHLPS